MMCIHTHTAWNRMRELYVLALSILDQNLSFRRRGLNWNTIHARTPLGA